LTGASTTSPHPAKLEQGMIAGGLALPPLEEQARGQKPERHAVAPIAECEPVPWVAAVRADVGEPVGRHGEQAFPGNLSANRRERREHPFEVCAQFARGDRELLATSLALPDETIAAAE
jgi:hypothetical protein